MRRAWLAPLCAVAALAAAAPGGWATKVDAVRVAGGGQDYTSARLVIPHAPADATLRRVQWQYAVPPGAQVAAQLCAGNECIVLASQRGQSEAFAGVPAATPLQFRFRLPLGVKTPVRVGAIQLVVDYD